MLNYLEESPSLSSRWPCLAGLQIRVQPVSWALQLRRLPGPPSAPALVRVSSRQSTMQIRSRSPVTFLERENKLTPMAKLAGGFPESKALHKVYHKRPPGVCGGQGLAHKVCSSFICTSGICVHPATSRVCTTCLSTDSLVLGAF